MFIPNDQIERSDIKLGKGQSGQAYLAKYNNRQVCLKSCPPPKPGQEVKEDLVKGIFKEAYKMRQFEHQNDAVFLGGHFFCT